MNLKWTVLLASIVWVTVISVSHVSLNWKKQAAFKVGFLPVTCHLTCPVTDYINKNTNQDGKGDFEPQRFQAFPELKEAFLSHNTNATFILAPLAMSLREQGVPIKIVYLGHRDGTAMMVHVDSQIFKIEDLRGKTVAVPNRFSNQRLLLFRALREKGMSFDSINLVEIAPPEMPAALATKSVDAITSGEPYMAQTELDGYGRPLYLTKDIWPNFISCVLAVHEDEIKKNRPAIQRLVDGIAKSGKWLDQTPDHRLQASEFVARNYYNQDPRLLRFVLSKPPDRVKYTNLSLRKKDFEEIEELGKAAGILKGTAHFEDYCDPSFVPDDSQIIAHPFEMQGFVRPVEASQP